MFIVVRWHATTTTFLVKTKPVTAEIFSLSGNRVQIVSWSRLKLKLNWYWDDWSGGQTDRTLQLCYLRPVRLAPPSSPSRASRERFIADAGFRPLVRFIVSLSAENHPGEKSSSTTKATTATTSAADTGVGADQSWSTRMWSAGQSVVIVIDWCYRFNIIKTHNRVRRFVPLVGRLRLIPAWRLASAAALRDGVSWSNVMWLTCLILPYLMELSRSTFHLTASVVVML